MVSRARGVLPDHMIDAGWPHQVVIEVPWNGLGKRLDAMLAWLYAHAPDHKKRSGRRPPGDGDVLHVCLVDRLAAERFQAEFGGELVLAEPPRPKRAR